MSLINKYNITSKRQEKSLTFGIINKVISEIHFSSEDIKLHAVVLVLNRLWVLAN